MGLMSRIRAKIMPTFITFQSNTILTVCYTFSDRVLTPPTPPSLYSGSSHGLPSMQQQSRDDMNHDSMRDLGAPVDLTRRGTVTTRVSRTSPQLISRIYITLMLYSGCYFKLKM